MKYSVLFILMLITSYSAYAQSEFTTFEVIKQNAEEADQPIMLVFSGSDWCKPCIKLKKTILDTPEFQEYSQNLKFIYLDFPYRKKLHQEETKRNELLAEKFNKNGAFPKVIIINHSEDVLGEVAYQKSMSSETFITEVEAIIR